MYVCVATNMVGERESEMAQLSVFGKRPARYVKTRCKWMLYICDGRNCYFVLCVCMSISRCVCVHFCVCCRAAHIRAQATKPGGPSGWECRVQMPGAGRSASVTALEEGRGRDSPHQVRKHLTLPPFTLIYTMVLLIPQARRPCRRTAVRLSDTYRLRH